MSSETSAEQNIIIRRCPCGLHAHIVLPSGYQSYDFFSCEDGLKIANLLFHSRKINEGELREISREIAGLIFLGEKVFTQLRNLMNQIIGIHGESPLMAETVTKILKDSINRFACEFLKKKRGAKSKKEDAVVDEWRLH